MQTLYVTLALGLPLLGWNLAVADAAGLDAWVEIAKQVPALLVLVWMVNKFLTFLKGRDEAFTSRIEGITLAFKESHDRSTEAINANTRATTRLYDKMYDSRDDRQAIQISPAERRRLGLD